MKTLRQEKLLRFTITPCFTFKWKLKWKWFLGSGSGHLCLPPLSFYDNHSVGIFLLLLQFLLPWLSCDAKWMKHGLLFHIALCNIDKEFVKRRRRGKWSFACSFYLCCPLSTVMEHLCILLRGTEWSLLWWTRWLIWTEKLFTSLPHHYITVWCALSFRIRWTVICHFGLDLWSSWWTRWLIWMDIDWYLCAYYAYYAYRQGG